eukprot:g13836.t1
MAEEGRQLQGHGGPYSRPPSHMQAGNGPYSRPPSHMQAGNGHYSRPPSHLRGNDYARPPSTAQQSDYANGYSQQHNGYGSNYSRPPSNAQPSDYHNGYGRNSSRPPSQFQGDGYNGGFHRPPSHAEVPQSQPNRRLETPMSQNTSTPTPNAPLKQNLPGRSIIGANGIQDHKLYKAATRKMTNAQVRKGHMFATSGIEPDIELNYSPRTVSKLVGSHHKRQDILDRRMSTAAKRNQSMGGYTKPIVIDQSPRQGHRGHSRHIINGGTTSFRNPIVDSTPAPTSTIAPRKYIDRVNGRFNPKASFELAIERPMAKKNYKRKYLFFHSNVIP